MNERNSADPAEGGGEGRRRGHRGSDSQDRVIHLYGVLCGLIAAIAILVVFQTARDFINRWLGVPLVPPDELVPLFFFAGGGTFVSVSTRLDKLKLYKDATPRLMFFTGLFRPFVSIILASVVFIILKNGVIPIRLGSMAEIPAQASTNFQPFVGYLASFLCGFSERFATDIIGRVPFGKSRDEDDD